MLTRRKRRVAKNQSKLVKRYIHTKGFSQLSGKMPEKKNVHFIRNRVLLLVSIGIFVIPGVYFCFY